MTIRKAILTVLNKQHPKPVRRATLLTHVMCLSGIGSPDSVRRKLSSMVAVGLVVTPSAYTYALPDS